MPAPLTAERFRSLSEAGDLTALGEYLADDVRWHEAGNPEVVVGREALMKRMGGMPQDLTTDLDCVLGDDTNLVAIGTAHFGSGDKALSYRFVDHYVLSDGLVVQRRAYMDAVPAEVAAAWPS